MTPTTARSRQGHSAFFGPFVPAGGDVLTAAAARRPERARVAI